MSDNVIILGAGFSKDAGIPLLSNFVDTMADIAVRKSWNGKAIPLSDIPIFDIPLEIRRDLDHYHGRANFDDRNLEDILSILTFNALGNNPRSMEHLKGLNRAIARTIELTCDVRHPGIIGSDHRAINTTGPDAYRSFWRALFDWASPERTLPTIISFNYDLVLERALFQVLNNTYYNSCRPVVNSRFIQVRYFYEKNIEKFYEVGYCDYQTESDDSFHLTPGSLVRVSDASSVSNAKVIEILKLHGSINFPLPGTDLTGASYSLVECLDNPYILPPIVNKLASETPNAMWETALERLRKAKNVILVGYSLPQADVTIQYFFKAGLGPNLGINKLFVFDPVLYKQNEDGRAMVERFRGCFADQLQKHIVFHPGGSSDLGTMATFVELLQQSPSALLY